MKNVIFGNYDAYLDFSLIRTNMVIGTPAPKMKMVEVEGSDGVIDLSDYFGDISYSNRQLSFEFETIKRQDEFIELFSTIQNAIHGRRLNVYISDDIDFHYVGRIIINEWKSDKRTGKIVIDVDADPYKYKNNKTVISKPISGTEYVHCYNLRKRAIPTIEVTAETAIVWNGKNSTLNPGVYSYIPGLVFTQGDNILEVSGNGIITISYQEGAL